MITVYKIKSIPKNLERIELNDVFFNKYTSEHIDDRAKSVINRIDDTELLSKYQIRSRFDGTSLNIDKLSTGCKTALNILYNPDKVFDIRECGDNALDVIYSFDNGNVCCDYPYISFDMTEVRVIDAKESRIISDYDELKRWWLDED